MIRDAFSASLVVVFFLAARRTGSPLAGYMTGTMAGLSLYGYASGRVVAASFLLLLPFLFTAFDSRFSRGRRGLLLLSLVVGFGMAAAPNLRFAVQHAAEWGGRFNQVGIFQAGWWGNEVRLLGSPWKVLERQLLAGTLGLLCLHPAWDWFTGYPIIAPLILPGLAVSGLGWLLGRRQYFAPALLLALIAGNLAGLVLTTATPAPQRASSLVPALSILGGVAIAAFLSLLPRSDRRGIPWRTAAGALIVGGWLVGTFGGPPGVWDPSPGYGASHAAFVRSAWQVLRAPRYRGETVLLHGRPYVDSRFPLFDYFLPRIRWMDVETSQGKFEVPASGLHLFSSEWTSTAVEWKKRWGLRGIALPETGDPRRNIGYLLFVPKRKPGEPGTARTGTSTAHESRD
jgi:hypothetical protein